MSRFDLRDPMDEDSLLLFGALVLSYAMVGVALIVAWIAAVIWIGSHSAPLGVAMVVAPPAYVIWRWGVVR